MNLEKLRDTLHQQPFRPFTIRMTDGRSFDVRHPDFVALSPAGRSAIVWKENGGYSLLDMRLMCEVQVQADEDAA